MNKRNLLFILLYFFLISSGLYSAPHLAVPLNIKTNLTDTLTEDQVLYNGKMWRNLYYMVKGDQYLFSREYAQGSVTINGKTYKDILVNYDIYNDEVLTPKKDRSIIQLNKEMVDGFTMVLDGKTYKFVNTEDDGVPGIKGYVKVLYSGKSSLYVKYKKEIASLAVDDKYDLFFRTYRIYLLKEGEVHQISKKSDLLKVLEEDKDRLKEYMKKNKLKVSKTDPESFIPVIRYYDSLSK